MYTPSFVCRYGRVSRSWQLTRQLTALEYGRLTLRPTPREPQSDYHDEIFLFADRKFFPRRVCQDKRPADASQPKSVASPRRRDTSSQSINRSRLMATACALRVHCCAAHVGTQPPPARRPIGADARHTEAAGPGHRPPVCGSRRLSMMCTSSHSHVPSGQARGPARNVWLASGGRQTALRDRRFFLPPVRLQEIRGP